MSSPSTTTVTIVETQTASATQSHTEPTSTTSIPEPPLQAQPPFDGPWGPYSPLPGLTPEMLAALGIPLDFGGFPQMAPIPPPPPVTVLPGGVEPGALITPFTAICAIFALALCYWMLKVAPQQNVSVEVSATTRSAATGDSKSSDKDSKDPAGDKPASDSSAWGSITPVAFASTFLFVLVAAIMVQGPLGLSQVNQAANDIATSSWTNPWNSETSWSTLARIMSLLDAPTLKSQHRTEQGDKEQPGELGGKFKHVGPNGAATAQWYIKDGEDIVSPKDVPRADSAPTIARWQIQKKGQTEIQDDEATGRLSRADKLTYLTLPPVLQALPGCKTQPLVCSAIASQLDLDKLPSQSLGPETAVKGTPIPLVPSQGFFGSYRGLQSIDNAFFPLLIGVIGLIVLFDYAT